MRRHIRFLPIVLCALLLLTACGNHRQTEHFTDTQASQSEAERNVASSTLPETGESETMSDKEQILAEYRRLQQAMIDRDIDTLREMMGADTTVRHITGRTQTMEEWLSDVEQERMKYYSIELKDPQVAIDGDTATLTCSNVIDARIYGSRGTWTLSGGANFEKVDGHWSMTQPEEN